MSGTAMGGYNAAVTNKLKYGDDFYRVIGTLGGTKGTTGGFYANRELARIAGAKGGSVSRRRKQGDLTSWERMAVKADRQARVRQAYDELLAARLRHFAEQGRAVA